MPRRGAASRLRTLQYVSHAYSHRRVGLTARRFSPRRLWAVEIHKVPCVAVSASSLSVFSSSPLHHRPADATMPRLTEAPAMHLLSKRAIRVMSGITGYSPSLLAGSKRLAGKVRRTWSLQLASFVTLVLPISPRALPALGLSHARPLALLAADNAPFTIPLAPSSPRSLSPSSDDGRRVTVAQW